MTKFKVQMKSKIQSSNEKVYDLEERTALYGEETIKFARSIGKDEVNRPLISQVVRSATSIVPPGNKRTFLTGHDLMAVMYRLEQYIKAEDRHFGRLDWTESHWRNRRQSQ